MKAITNTQLAEMLNELRTDLASGRIDPADYMAMSQPIMDEIQRRSAKQMFVYIRRAMVTTEHTQAKAAHR